jgi:hypothetical protein
MSNKKSSRRKKKVSNINPSLALYQKFDRYLTASSEKKEIEGFGLLSESIYKLLHKGKEGVLRNALVMCSNIDEYEDFYEIMNSTCESYPLFDEDCNEAFLFAIPIIFVSDSSSQSISEIIDPLTKSLRKFGLINEFPTVAMLPELYLPDELPIGFCERQDLLISFLEMFQGEENVGPQLIKREVDDNLKGPILAVKLKFLVGSIVGNEEEFYFNCDGYDKEEDDWSEYMNKLLTTEGVQANVLSPMLLSEAVKSGVIGFYHLGLLNMIEGAMLSNTHSSAYCLLIETPKESDEQKIFISICKSKSMEYIDSMEWLITETTESYFDFVTDIIVDTAKEAGLKIIKTVNDDGAKQSIKNQH